MARGGGGGGRGGGFSGGVRGGSFGGGFSGGHHGGSFGGGMNRGGMHHHPSMHRPVVHHHHGYGVGTRRSGGCCSGFGCGVFLLPLFFFLFLASLFSGNNSQTTMTPEPDYSYNSSVIVYDEGSMEDFASAYYEKAFGHCEAYEDNLLLAFVVWEDRSDFSYLAWVGDDISNGAFALLGGNDTALGQILERYVQYGYEDSLSDDLSRGLNALASELEDLGRIYTCSEDHSDTLNAFYNKSDLRLDNGMIEEAMADFTERTGIPFALVIAEAEDIFG